MADLSVRRVIAQTIQVLVILISFAVVGSAAAQNVESDWWFDIEFIAFKRDILPGHPEDFQQTDFDFTTQSPIDLFSVNLFKRANPLFRLTASLPDCDTSKQMITFDSLTLNPIDISALMTTAVSFVDSLSPPEALIDDVPLDIDSAAFIAQQESWLSAALPTQPALKCISELTYEAFNKVPRALFDDANYPFGHHHLLGLQDTSLADYAKRVFGQRDITPLIHTAWRQPVEFGEDQASFYRIIAGELLAPSENLYAATNTEEMLDETTTEATPELQRSEVVIKQLTLLKSALDSKRPVSWEQNDTDMVNEQQEPTEFIPQWELNGLFKVYLDYVNRIPYLHIDSEFKHAKLDFDASGAPIINTFSSNQRRRIISKQIHYFDHPAFGIIVRLERYLVPDESELSVPSL